MEKRERQWSVSDLVQQQDLPSSMVSVQLEPRPPCLPKRPIQRQGISRPLLNELTSAKLLQAWMELSRDVGKF